MLWNTLISFITLKKESIRNAQKQNTNRQTLHRKFSWGRMRLVQSLKCETNQVRTEAFSYSHREWEDMGILHGSKNLQNEFKLGLSPKFKLLASDLWNFWKGKICCLILSSQTELIKFQPTVASLSVLPSTYDSVG